MKSFIFQDFPVMVFICEVNINRSDEWPGLTGGQSLNREKEVTVWRIRPIAQCSGRVSSCW
jgi:hypothetical protein